MTYSDDDLRLDEMEFENITIDQHGPIAVLTVNRPKALNALNGTTLSELAMAADLIANDPEVGALIVTGADGFIGSCFVAKVVRMSCTRDMMTSPRCRSVLQILIGCRPSVRVA